MQLSCLGLLLYHSWEEDVNVFIKAEKESILYHLQRLEVFLLWLCTVLAPFGVEHK